MWTKLSGKITLVPLSAEFACEIQQVNAMVYYDACGFSLLPCSQGCFQNQRHINSTIHSQYSHHVLSSNHAVCCVLQKDGQKKEPVPEIPSEIYCKVCGVSFNSPKQAQQHYMGKNHSKKIRATSLAANGEISGHK